MPRTIAFLRAINVGGHTVTMEALRRHFEALKLADVETFIASGNVIFRSTSGDPAKLEAKIEKALHGALGYEVATFLRTDAEVAAVAAYEAFPAKARAAARAYCVGFLQEPLTAAQKKGVLEFRTDEDDFHVNGREIYWLCKVGQADSKFSNARMEKVLKTRATFRGLNTVVRLAAKYPAEKR